MAHRPSQEMYLALRGVHEEPYLKRGCRVFVSVDSRGELVGERLVRKGAAQWRVDDAHEQLMAELNDVDPVMPHDRPPSLRLL